MRRLLTDRVLTDETRLALLVRILWLWHLILGVALDAVHLEDIVEDTRRRRLVIVVGTRSTTCDSGWDEMHKHTRSDNVAVAVAVSTVAVVVRQVVRVNAVAHVVSVPRYDKKSPKKSPAKEAGKMCLEQDLKQLAVQQLPSICTNQVLTNCDVRQP